MADWKDGLQLAIFLFVCLVVVLANFVTLPFRLIWLWTWDELSKDDWRGMKYTMPISISIWIALLWGIGFFEWIF